MTDLFVYSGDQLAAARSRQLARADRVWVWSMTDSARDSHRTPETTEADIGALRSSLIARLTGLTMRQLGYWHRSYLLSAHVVAGARGTPRLYSWSDYVRIREAAKLAQAGLPTKRIRKLIEYLQREIPDWYLVPLRVDGEHVIARVRQVRMDVYADLRGQYPLILQTLMALHSEGPLGELREYSDAVDMNPQVNAGVPVVAGTRVETHLLATLSKWGRPVEEIAKAYHLRPERVHRAIQFEQAAA